VVRAWWEFSRWCSNCATPLFCFRRSDLLDISFSFLFLLFLLGFDVLFAPAVVSIL
jgi:hypothetical protein